MRILYFSFVELDVPNACQTHTLGVLDGFSQNKIRVDAVVPRPSKVRLSIPSVKFLRIWPWRFSVIGASWVKFACGCLFLLLCMFNKYDAIYVREIELNPFPRWISKLFGIPLYIEINSLLEEDLKLKEYGEKYIRCAMAQQAADLRHASGLISAAYFRGQVLSQKYQLSPGKIHFILNGFDPNTIKKMDRKRAEKIWNLPTSSFNLGFLGTIWKMYDLENLLSAVKIAGNRIPQIRLVLIGGGPKTAEVLSIASEMGIDSNLISLGFVQPENLYSIMAAIDVGLITVTRQGLDIIGPITTRFATYAAYRVPVIANEDGRDQFPIKMKNGLVLIEPEDPELLAEKIEWLYENTKDRLRLGHVLYEYAINELTWKTVAEKIQSIIKIDKDRNIRRKILTNFKAAEK